MFFKMNKFLQSTKVWLIKSTQNYWRKENFSYKNVKLTKIESWPKFFKKHDVYNDKEFYLLQVEPLRWGFCHDSFCWLH